MAFPGSCAHSRRVSWVDSLDEKIRELLERQAAWQRGRASLSWEEKLEMSLTMREAQDALRSADEGKTWTASPIFRDPAKYCISDERALLRTRGGVVLSGGM